MSNMLNKFLNGYKPKEKEIYEFDHYILIVEPKEEKEQ